MGAWSAVSKSRIALTVRRLFRLQRAAPFAVVVMLVHQPQLPAESSLAFRVAAQYSAPLGETDFGNGPAVSGSLDFQPSTWSAVFLRGGYTGIPLDTGESIALSEGTLGASLRRRIGERLSVRGDLEGGVYSASAPTGSISGIAAGAGLSAAWRITPSLAASANLSARHYMYSPRPFMNSVSLGMGLSVDIGELVSPRARVLAEPVKTGNVFPVFYSWYDDNPFGSVRITNHEDTTITGVRGSFYLEQFMSGPKLCAEIESLAPGQSAEIPLTAFFNEAMLNLTESIEAEGRFLLSYDMLGSKRHTEIQVRLPVQHRNAMSWEDDRRAAAFVSAKDPAALWFSRYVSSVVQERFRPGLSRNMQYAIGIFESLNQYGLNYVIDPASSYADLSGSGASLDFLQYPYQTLMYRGGDCDDISILFCSLLEGIGVRSAFITIPGHIFIGFDSGFTGAEALSVFGDLSQFAVVDGEVWVPLEITLTKEGFAKAWRIGAKEWGDAFSRGDAALYPVRSAWSQYRPVSVPGAASRFSLPEDSKTAAAFDGSIDTLVERLIRPQVRGFEAQLAKKDDPAVRNSLGILYGRYGMLSRAKQQFTAAAGSGYSRAWVNLGNIAFMEQKYSEALGYYSWALSRDPSLHEAVLGSARCYYEMDEFGYSDALYAELGSRDMALYRDFSYLGSFFDKTGRAWSFSERLETTVWSESLPTSLPSSVQPQLSTQPVVKKAENPPVLKTSLDEIVDRGSPVSGVRGEIPSAPASGNPGNGNPQTPAVPAVPAVPIVQASLAASAEPESEGKQGSSAEGVGGDPDTDEDSPIPQPLADAVLTASPVLPPPPALPVVAAVASEASLPPSGEPAASQELAAVPDLAAPDIVVAPETITESAPVSISPAKVVPAEAPVLISSAPPVRRSLASELSLFSEPVSAGVPRLPPVIPPALPPAIPPVASPVASIPASVKPSAPVETAPAVKADSPVESVAPVAEAAGPVLKAAEAADHAAAEALPVAEIAAPAAKTVPVAESVGPVPEVAGGADLAAAEALTLAEISAPAAKTVPVTEAAGPVLESTIAEIAAPVAKNVSVAEAAGLVPEAAGLAAEAAGLAAEAAGPVPEVAGGADVAAFVPEVAAAAEALPAEVSRIDDVQKPSRLPLGAAVTAVLVGAGGVVGYGFRRFRVSRHKRK